MANEMDWSPRPEPKAGFAKIIEVATYDPDAEPDKRYRVLPNIQCEQIQYREGASPPTARFRYLLDNTARARGWPTQFETILRLHGKPRPEPLDEGDKEAAEREKPELAEQYVVKTDDRLIVIARDPGNPKANPSILFDGYAQSPQVNVSGRSQDVTFVAAGTAIRLWDEPMVRATWRHADIEVQADLDQDDAPYHRILSRVVFNPTVMVDDSRPSSSALNRPGNAVTLSRTDNTDLAFRDPKYATGGGVPHAKAWVLDQIVRYLLEVEGKGSDNEFVRLPEAEWVRDELKLRTPKDGHEFFDPDNPDTYDTKDAAVVEYDATGKPWPEVLAALLGHYGFTMAFRLVVDDDGLTRNELKIYRKDGTGAKAAKSIPFQRSGEELKVGRQAVSSLSIARDYMSAFNSVAALTRPSLYEICVVLRPVMPVTLQGYEGSPRTWTCPEVRAHGWPLLPPDGNGKRWYDLASGGNSRIEPTADFSQLWFAILASDAIRPRRCLPGRSTLLSRDSGRPRRASLHVSTDYEGPVGDFWDHTGTWLDVAPGHGWRLLKNRLGVELTAPDLNKWNIGPGENGRPRVVRGMEKMLDRQAETIYLKLVTVIEDDVGVSQIVERRKTSPLKFDRTRVIDVGDAMSAWIHESSPHFRSPGLPWSGPPDQIKPSLKKVRDDKPQVRAHLKQVQALHENPPIAGTITIPWVTEAYEIGDQIDEISGRGLSLQTNAGDEQGEAKRYPYVVGVDWSFAGGGQSTTLHLSDSRAEPIRQW